MFSSFFLFHLPSSSGLLESLDQVHTRTLVLGGGPRVQIRVGGGDTCVLQGWVDLDLILEVPLTDLSYGTSWKSYFSNFLTGRLSPGLTGFLEEEAVIPKELMLTELSPPAPRRAEVSAPYPVIP